MRRVALRTIFAFDRACFALFRLRWRRALQLDGPVSPNLRFARIRAGPGARIELAPGVTMERKRGNAIWVQQGGTLRLGARTWLRTEHGENHVTVFPGARIELGADCLLNGAMLHAKSAISIGANSMLGFGVRVLDADFHDLDRATPERIEPIRIGERVWVGADALILRGVTIGDDVVVAAGSIVTRDLPPRVLAVGAPARPVRAIEPRIGCR